jgi:hypothetical protein
LSVVTYKARWHHGEALIQASTTTNHDRRPINLDTKLSLLLFKMQFYFFQFDINNWCSQIPLEHFVCFWVHCVMTDKSWSIFPNSIWVFVVCFIRNDYWILSLDYASFIVETYLHINYQRRLAHLLSTSIAHWLLTLTCASTTNIDHLCTHILQVTICRCGNAYFSPWIFTICHWSNHSPWIPKVLLFCALKLFDARNPILLDKDWQYFFWIIII